jgi:hypothetical protein
MVSNLLVRDVSLSLSCFPMNDNDDDLQLKPSVSGLYFILIKSIVPGLDNTFSQ